MASEYMDAQKQQAQISLLERKVEQESHGFEHVEEYQSDKMLLDSLKREAVEEQNTVQDTVKEDKQILDAVEKIVKK